MGFITSNGLSSTPTTSVTTAPSADLQPYVQNVLQKGNALLNAPTPAYTGQMTAGPSDIQNQAWSGLSGLTLPTAMTQSASNLQDIQGKQANYSFDPNSVSQYMNPYLQQSLNPQLDAARRQSQIDQQNAIAASIKSGSFGGGAGDVMARSATRDLGANLANITGTGYKNAYDEAMKAAQYSSDLGLKGLQAATQSNQAAGNIGAQESTAGLANLQALSTAGNTQQGQNQAGLNSQYNEWLRQQKYLPDQLKSQQGLISGMPGGTTANTYGATPSGLQQAVGTAAGISQLISNMKSAGKDAPAINAALKAIGINPDTMQTDPAFASTVVNDQSQQENPNVGPNGEVGYWDDNGDWQTGTPP